MSRKIYGIKKIKSDIKIDKLLILSRNKKAKVLDWPLA